MGIKISKAIKWSEDLISSYLKDRFFSHSNIRYMAENLYIYNWESDLWILTKAGLSYEFEIKISRNDFKNDAKNKKSKQILLKENFSSDNLLDNNCPNYFYYAVPKGLISVEEVPEYSGLIYMSNIFPYYEIVKVAPKINKEKNDIDKLNLLNKFYFNYRNLKDKLLNEGKMVQEMPTDKKYLENIKDLKKRVKDLETELKISNSIIRNMNSILISNNIDFDLDEIEQIAIEKYSKKK